MITLALTSMLLACVTSQQSSTGNRHVIKKSVLHNDTIEFSVDDLFPNRGDDARYESILPETDQIVRIKSAIQPTSFYGSSLLRGCIEARRLSLDIVVSLCNNKSAISVFTVSTNNQTVTLVHSYWLNLTGRIVVCWQIDVMTNNIVVLFNDEAVSNRYTLEYMGKGAQTGVTSFMIHIRMIPDLEKIKLHFSGQYLYITGFNSYSAAFNGAYSFVIRPFINTFTPEAYWYSSAPIPDEGQQFAWQQRKLVLNSSIDKISDILYHWNMAYIVSLTLERLEAGLFATVAIDACSFTEKREMLVCSDNATVVDVLLIPSIFHKVTVHLKELGLMSFNLPPSWKSVVVATESVLGVYMLGTDGSIYLKEKKAIQQKLSSITEIVAAEVYKDCSLAILFRKVSESCSLALFNLKEGILYQRQEIIHSESAALLFHEKSSNRDFMIFFRDLEHTKNLYPPGIKEIGLYRFERDILITNFAAAKPDKNSTYRVLTSTILSGRDNSVIFVFQINFLENPISSETAFLYSEIETYRYDKPVTFYLPTEITLMPVVNMTISAPFTQSPDVTMIIQEVHLSMANKLNFKTANQSKLHLNATFELSSRVYTFVDHMLFHRHDSNIEIYRCTPDIISKAVDCRSQTFEYRLADGDVIIDYQIYDHREISAVVMILVSNTDNSYLLVSDIAAFNDSSSTITSKKIDIQNVLDQASIQFNGSMVVIFGLRSIQALTMIYEYHFNMSEIYRTSKLPGKILEYSQLSLIGKITLNRLDMDTYMITGRSLHGYLIHTSRLVDYINSTANVSAWKMEKHHYIMIAVHANSLLLLDNKAGDLYLSGRSIESQAEQYLLVPTGLCIHRSDILAYVTAGRIGYMIVNRSLLVLDISGLEVNPYRRLIKSVSISDSLYEEIKRASMGIDSSPWSKGYLQMDRGNIYALTSVLKGHSILVFVFYTEKNTFKTSYTTILDLYGPNYLATLYPSTQSPARTLLTIDVTNINNMTWYTPQASITLKMYSTLMSTAVKKKRFTISQKTSFNLNNIVVSNSHISEFKIDSSFVEVSQSIVKASEEAEMLGLADHIYHTEDIIIIHKNYRILVGEHDVWITDLNRSQLMYHFPKSFNPLNLLVEQISERPDEFTIIFLLKGEMDLVHFKIYQFNVIANPGKYEITYVMNACKCRDARSSLLSYSSGYYLIGIQYSMKDDQGIWLATSILKVEYYLNPKSESRYEILAWVNGTVHKHYVPQNPLSYNMISSESLLLQYYFMENSGFVNSVILYFDNAGNLMHTRIGWQRLMDLYILPPKAQVNCRRYKQELVMSCLIYNDIQSVKIRQFSIQFRLDDDRLSVVSNSYDLYLPIGYVPDKLMIGEETDLVLAKNVVTEKLELFFYDTMSGNVFRVLKENDLPEGYLTSNKILIIEYLPDLWIFPTDGLYLSDCIYKRVEPLITISPTAKVISDCTYFLDYIFVHGINSDVERFSLESFIDLQCGYNYWPYIGLFSGVILVMAVTLLIMQYSNSDFDIDPFQGRRLKKLSYDAEIDDDKRDNKSTEDSPA